MIKDKLLRRAERVQADAIALKNESRALRQLRQLERDLEAATRKLAQALRRYGVDFPARD